MPVTKPPKRPTLDTQLPTFSDRDSLQDLQDAHDLGLTPEDEPESAANPPNGAATPVVGHQAAYRTAIGAKNAAAALAAHTAIRATESRELSDDDDFAVETMTQPSESSLAMPLDRESSLFSTTPEQHQKMVEQLRSEFLQAKKPSVQETRPVDDPNRPETEEDGIRAEALRRLKVRLTYVAQPAPIRNSSTPAELSNGKGKS